MYALATIVGVVTRHHGRGKQLGFPTANIAVDAAIPQGVFAGTTRVAGALLPSVIFVGAAETFGDAERFAESYILDWSGSLYGATVELTLAHKLRESIKFSSPEKLVRQMQEDVRRAREYFASHNYV